MSSYSYNKRKTFLINPKGKNPIGSSSFPKVFITINFLEQSFEKIIKEICYLNNTINTNKIEGVCFLIKNEESIILTIKCNQVLKNFISYFVLELDDNFDLNILKKYEWYSHTQWIFIKRILFIKEFLFLISFIEKHSNRILSIDTSINYLNTICNILKNKALISNQILFTSSRNELNYYTIGTYRKIVDILDFKNLYYPIWLKLTNLNSINKSNDIESITLEASIVFGSLLCEGIGDLISIEINHKLEKIINLSYNLLQSAKLRFFKTEFISCPSCGRTLFDIETITKKIQAKTKHLSGVKIAIMGCIVNGPGEMMDANFGYVGGAPGKINLYIGQKCIKYNVPEINAVAELVNLIKKENLWIEP